MLEIMKAIGKYIIIEELKEDIKKTDGGLMLAESHREDIRYRKGKVISIGTNVNGIEEGDCIWYDRHAGNNLEIDNTIFKVIEERDVIIVL
ncbi:MAG: putative chaperonin 10 Kd subunit [Prokaryotic dsDNA virus sp.]|nr:MAG: putative chaperonin 10 Kd subunit [Prokaryotic dsDNA virus sp.]|tara:strand:- start:44716 stop:44988 length:273 start_codon:yes stop_codon:yes gene_type:complete